MGETNFVGMLWLVIISFIVVGGPFLVAQLVVCIFGALCTAMAGLFALVCLLLAATFGGICLCIVSIKEFIMKKVRPLYKRIRRAWQINPRERIHEGKRKEDQKNDPCASCPNRSLVVCLDCEHWS